MESKQQKIVLFAYGSLLRGEAHHNVLDSCPSLGEASTAAGYRLVELQSYPCMIATGNRMVEGELYEIDRVKQRQIDLLKENARLFHRRTIKLSSGESAQAYLMNDDQVRGRRRLQVDSWRQRFAPRSGRSY